jgi:murein DD-endopeptidase MepM/ murein hydrolase activator NlpD
MRKMNQLLRYLLFLLLLGLTAGPTAVYSQTNDADPDANEGEAEGPRLHIVQSGETLTSIALLYDTTVEALQRLNSIVDPSLLYVGQELLIPGSGGEVVIQVVIQAGDTLAGLAAAYNASEAELAETNRLINPYHLVAGQSLAVVSRTEEGEPQTITGIPHLTRVGETPLMLAVRYNLSVAELAAANDLAWPPRLLAGQRLRIPDEERPYRPLSGEWAQISVAPLPLVQGETAVVYVENVADGLPSGYLAGQPLRFTPYEEGYIALLGFDAFTEPGAYELELGGGGSQPWRPFNQSVVLISGNYGAQMITLSPALAPLLEPQVRADEDALLQPIYSQFQAERQWDSLFRSPVTTTVMTAGYGIARAYNGGGYNVFHAGVDFAGPTGTIILAAAPGEVIFNDQLEVRGNTVIINHGWGVMTSYAHLERSLVTVGQQVNIGQIIGEMGSTGLSTGPHLHWELRIMNVPVNGLSWTRRPYP